MRSSMIVFGVVLSLAATACEATFESQARDAFSDAYGCQPTQVTAAAPTKPDRDDVSYAVVRAQGCGHEETYVCASDWTIGCHARERR